MLLQALIVASLIGLPAVALGIPFTWSASLLPSASLTAAPGETTGWGYTITNNDNDYWLVPFQLNHDLFEYSSTNSLFTYPAIAPGVTVTTPYNGTSGLFEFTWAPTVPIGFTNVGLFEIETEWWSGDPDQGGSLLETTDPFEILLAYSGTAVESHFVPEPSGLLLALTGGGVLMLFRRAAGRRRKTGP